MKWILTMVIVLFCMSSYGQLYQAMPQPGYGPVKRMWIDSVLVVPTNVTSGDNLSGGREVGKIRYNITDSSLQAWTGYQWRSGGSISAPAISSLTAATATNDIDNASNKQIWRWSGLAQYGLVLDAATTAAINQSSLFSSGVSGANAAAGRTTNSGLFQNTHTGSSSTNNGIRTVASGGTFNRGVDASVSGAATSNYAYYASASGGTNNYGLYVSDGDVNLQPLTASQFLTLDANKNMTSSAVASSILAASLSDETGTDKVVFNTSPSFVTSVIGGASFDVFNTVSTTLNIGGAATTMTIGGTPTTAITHNYSTNATAAATTKTINFGTGGASGSTTAINIGSATSGAAASIKLNLEPASDANWDLYTRNASGFLERIGNGTTGQVLTATTNAKPAWAAASGGGITVGTTTITSGTSGAIPFNNAGVYDEDATKLFWDNTNDRLGIGTNSPGTTIHATAAGAVGKFVSTGYAQNTIEVADPDGSMYITNSQIKALSQPFILNANGSFIDLQTGGVQRVKIASTGIVTMTAYGAGAATFDASGNISSVSDIRLKNKRSNYSGGLKELMKINPIIYKWKPSSGMETKHDYIGFSAQNIRSSLGEDAIGINKQGYLSIQDRAILAVAINAIQELKELNDKQQKEIDNLKQIIKNK